jgi:bifunctional N-acetylglucosamine-1-phosphate-uridyltransferase/glucosamine-1-phosphate-acetyltransferase GlmU-like protein
MMSLTHYISRINDVFPSSGPLAPWNFTQQAEAIIMEKMSSLGPDFRIFNHVAIHTSVTIDSHAIIKAPAIISSNCFVGAHCYLRGGVFLDEAVSVGPGCEVKTSFVFSHSALAHFNFVGDSMVGSHVNLEAGAVIANHYNERRDKKIMVRIGGKYYATGVQKFGALVGDHTKIGANSVLSPGTILDRDTIVKRLELIDQSANGQEPVR